MNELERYIVIPTKYLEFFSESETEGLKLVIEAIKSIRLAANKDVDPNYIVCKETEPYANTVWKLILRNQNQIDEQMTKAHEELDELNDIESVIGYDFDIENE